MARNEPKGWWRPAIGATALALVVPLAGVGAAGAATAEPALGDEMLVASGVSLGEATSAVSAAGGEVVESLPIADSLVVRLPEGSPLPSSLTAVPDVDITFNSLAMDDSAPLANTFRDTIDVPDGLTGEGVTVAVVDTGVADVDDLPSVEHVNVSDGPQGDSLGHGTFMAGLIAGNGTNSDGAYTGVAPDAEILDVQVARADGSTDLTTVLRGLQAVADRSATDPSLGVVLLALSTGSPLPPHVDPLSSALTNLWRDGLTVVVASGNDGAGELSSPATNPVLLAVGSIDENGTADRGDDVLSDFSSYGKAFGIDRPDVVAPGRTLVATTAPGSIAATANPDSLVGNGYIKGSGTSMAAAVTAGATAVLLSGRPDLAPDQVKVAFTSTAYAAPNFADGVGAGLLDLSGALDADVSSLAPATPTPGGFVPPEEDADAWAQFAAGWEADDFEMVRQGWLALSPDSRRWAASMWSTAVLSQSLTLDDENFDSRRWASRRWATENWNSRRWAEDNWVSRRWADANYDSRRWADEEFVSRRWAQDDWLGFAWSSRRWADSEWVSRRWADENWNSRRWADEDWNSRRWASTEWVSRRWASDAWDSRRWADVDWDSRRWAQVSMDSRRWATDAWDSRRWASVDW